MRAPTSLVYLDTSALMRRAEAKVVAPTPRNQHIAPIVDAVLNDVDTRVAMSQLTLLEFRDALALGVRQSRPHEVYFDVQWMTSCLRDVMRLLATDKVDVVEAPPSAADRATVLVDLATRDHGVAFRVWDAMHLVTACSWGHAEGTQVRLLTSDTDYDRFVALYPMFNKWVRIENVDPGGLASVFE